MYMASNRRSVATRLPVRRLRIDDAMLGRENAVEFYRTSAVEYLFGEKGGGHTHAVRGSGVY